MRQSAIAPIFSNPIWSWLRSGTQEDFLIKNDRVRIFLISFTMLFFELLCIRWIPSYVRYLSYFNNFILLATFLGTGIGMLSVRRTRFWFPPFPVMVLFLTVIVAWNRFDLHITSTQVLYYGVGETQSASAENFSVLPIIFGLVAACFIPLGRSFGQLFTRIQPLTAYTFDIIGSLIGISCFSLIAFFAFPPLAWFLILAIPVILLGTKRMLLAIGAVFLVCLVIAGQLQAGAYWSPYYRIQLSPVGGNGYIVNVNNSGHQTMIPWQHKEPFYRRVYQLFPGKSFHHALILGAGTGSDVSTALAYGVQDVTAVEIDPMIQNLGYQYHPDHPYSNPHVRVVINDGRSFLQNTTEHFDLIIFALPDSLTLTSSNTSLRLESFLLTQESINAARSRLSSNGMVVLYNYYREPWLMEKIANMAGHAFNQEPLVSTYGGWGRAAVIMAGPRLHEIPPGTFGSYQEKKPDSKMAALGVIGEGYYPLTNITLATDDWPFLYLREHSFPLIYIAGLAMIAIFAFGGIFSIAPRGVLRRFDWHMFFLGVAFMLLEVKSLTTFALLFGSTWLVNSLVFFAILCSVLLAVLVNRWLSISRIMPFYLLLFAILVLNLVLPPETLLISNPVARYLLASFLAFAPVFLANLIFANSFRDSETADIAFASNLIGIMVGGGLEYLSMLTGYRLLLVPVIIFYACALFLRRRRSTEASIPVDASITATPSPAVRD